MRRFLPVLIIFVLAGFINPAKAQNTPAKPCQEPSFHQFDFWIGNWQVYTPDGKKAGTNDVKQLVQGCLIQENWKSARSPYQGTSYNTFDKATGMWQQTWVDNSGLVLNLRGHFKNGVMRLSGVSKSKNGKWIENEISWVGNNKGEVIQTWSQRPQKTENSKITPPWKIVFKGIYKKEPEK